jgi:hypothetical protein
MAKKGKVSDQKVVKNYLNLFYMTPNEVCAKDIAEFFQADKGLVIELWESMNVLELELSNQNSIDFEPVDASFRDPSDASFIKNRRIKTIFGIMLCDTDLSLAIPYFEQLVDKFGGFVCTDSDNFNPFYAGSAN